MHEIMHEIILATIVLTLQRIMHEHFVTIPTLSCMNRTASGGVGDVYVARDILTKQEAAIKLESVLEGHAKLEHECSVYNQLAGGPGIPRVYWFGSEMGVNAMVLERLGPSLEDLFIQCQWRFSVCTVTQLAIQLVRQLRNIRT
jgi:serine/threonine protein kinase